MAYSAQYISHFTNPKGVGEIENPTTLSEVQHEGDGCFDRVKLMLNISDGTIKQTRFKARACSGTIAACSALVEAIEGKNIKDIKNITPENLIDILGGIPDKKRHSVELAIEALKRAIDKL